MSKFDIAVSLQKPEVADEVELARANFERLYRAQIIRVTVLASGFEYHGKNYASLSAIAHRVTGTRWNGFHFFGLRQEWKA